MDVMRAVCHDGKEWRHCLISASKEVTCLPLDGSFRGSTKGVPLYLSAGLLSEQPRERRGWVAKPGALHQKQTTLTEPKLQGSLRADSGKK